MTTIQEARISTRINAELKLKAEKTLKELGVKPSQAITMFYTQVIQHKGLPFAVNLPNDTTVKALEQDLSKQKRHQSLESVMDDLLS